MLVAGLRLALSRPGAVLWTYAAGFVTAVLFSLRPYIQLSQLLDHSLAAQRLTAAFDLSTAVAASQRISRDVPSTGAAGSAGIPLYLCVYFLLVPGTLFVYRLAPSMPATLSVLLGTGLRFFWRFVRITLLTLVASAIVLGPLSYAATAWANHIDETHTGATAFYLQQAGWLVVLLAAALLRLYFDLVEVYTVQLDGQLRTTGVPDRRVRRTLLPALRTLGAHAGRAYGSFLLLLLLGLLSFGLFARTALHTLAKPSSLPVFLLAQIALLLMLFTRFWQRAAETILAAEHPLSLPLPATHEAPSFETDPMHSALTDPTPHPASISPSLDLPDLPIAPSGPAGGDPVN